MLTHGKLAVHELSPHSLHNRTELVPSLLAVHEWYDIRPAASPEKFKKNILKVERWAEWGFFHDHNFTLKYHIHNSSALCFDM